MSKAWDIVAYVYEADHHCTDCTRKRFPELFSGNPDVEVIDREGNPVGVCFASDEHETAIYCGDCGALLDE